MNWSAARRNADRVWVRSGTVLVAAVSMQSGDRYSIHKTAIHESGASSEREKAYG